MSDGSCCGCLSVTARGGIVAYVRINLEARDSRIDVDAAIIILPAYKGHTLSSAPHLDNTNLWALIFSTRKSE